MRNSQLAMFIRTFVFGCAFVLSQNCHAVESTWSDASGNPEIVILSHVAVLPSGGGSSDAITCAGTQVSQLGTFTIVINAGSTLAANTAALAAFNRAAAQWEARISDPVTITINADLANLGSTTTIGQSSTVMLQADYATIRDQVVSDAADEADDQIVSYLPNASQFSAVLPEGFGLDGNLIGSKANLKALGFTELDEDFGTTDATIKFNTRFRFDYDNRDGVTSGTMDFETVAAHELGHALGFLSTVDAIDKALLNSTTGNVGPTTLDLFRFDNDSTLDPSTTAEFTTYARSLVPNSDEITDQVLAPWGDLSAAEFRMSTGSYTGDGRQASHWKDNDLTGSMIGVMDPTLGYTQVNPISEADFRALDLIGYEISAIPEPGTLVLLALAVPCLLAYVWRRRRAS
jgi:hypothetical protein